MTEVLIKLIEGDSTVIERKFFGDDSKSHSDSISATSLTDKPVPIHFVFHNHGQAPSPLYLTKSIKNISGAADGANAIVTVQGFDLFKSAFDDCSAEQTNKYKIYRVRETIDQLRAAFTDVGVPMPKTKSGFRAAVSNSLKFIFD